ncbi:MAG TPA: PilZ domain-containing protein [Polyangiaceae bacterium]|nr:PilZ domain-containing protein [Polyangiaceae bacterium]
MSYSGALIARSAREELGKALATLQEDPRTPPDVMGVAQNIAQAVGALFDAESAKDDRSGKNCVRSALGSLSQTMALLQDLKSGHRGVVAATATIASAMSKLHPLTAVPSIAPPRIPSVPPGGAPVALGRRAEIEANVGASSETNFYVGFSGEIAEGGVFVATYNTLDVGSLVSVTVTLPGGYEFRVPGYVHFVRDPMDMSDDSEPGMGVRFEQLQGEHRELILRFIRKRAPMFFDD